MTMMRDAQERSIGESVTPEREQAFLAAFRVYEFIPTGHEHVDSVGLIHMNGRAYDPELGRFLSVDPLVQAPTNSQNLNPYSYVMNNPMSGTDPTGYKSCVAEEESNCPLADDKKEDKVTVKKIAPTGSHIKSQTQYSLGNATIVTEEHGGATQVVFAAQFGADRNGRSQGQGVKSEGVKSPADIGSSANQEIRLTASGSAAGATPANNVSPDVVGTSATDADAMQNLSGAHSTDPTETGFVNTTDGGRQQLSGCTNAYCPVADSKGINNFTGKPSCFSHSHVVRFGESSGDYNQDRAALEESFMRMYAGPGDAAVVTRFSAPNYVKGTDGIVRVVERVNGVFRMRTVTPGAADLPNQQSWSPGHNPGPTPEQRKVLKSFDKGSVNFRNALKIGGVSGL